MGPPTTIYSDQETGLLADFREHCIMYNITTVTSLPRSQHENSQAELGVKMMKAKLIALLNDPEFQISTEKDWEELLPDITQAINTTPFEKQPYTRELLQFGKQSKGTIPMGDYLNLRKWENIEEYIEDLEKTTQELHTTHLQNMNRNRQNRARIRPKRESLTKNAFTKNALVLFHDLERKPLTNKSQLYKVTDIYEKGLQIKNCETGTKRSTNFSEVRPVFRSEMEFFYPKDMFQKISRLCLDINKQHPNSTLQEKTTPKKTQEVKKKTRKKKIMENNTPPTTRSKTSKERNITEETQQEK